MCIRAHPGSWHTDMVLLLCGGVGSGKSVALQILQRRYGAELLGMDEAAHELYRPGGKACSFVLSLLGSAVLSEDGSLNRKKMAELLYADPARMERLNRVIHPMVYAEVAKRIRRNRAPLLVVETALPSGDKSLYNEVWYVHSSIAVREERLRKSRGYSTERIHEIMGRQMTEEAFFAYADRVIENDGTEAELIREIDRAAKAAGLSRREAEEKTGTEGKTGTEEFGTEAHRIKGVWEDMNKTKPKERSAT